MLSIKQEIHFTKSLGKQTQSANQLWSVYVITKEKNISKILQKLRPEN